MPYNAGPMTEAMYYVLLALMHPGHGYQLMQTIEDISQGRVKMGPGTLYGVLTRLQKEKLIVIVSDDGRRKTYSVTDEGKNALNAEYDRIRAMICDGEKIITEQSK